MYPEFSLLFIYSRYYDLTLIFAKNENMNTRKTTNMNNPSVIGLKRSFGFGDRLGLAGPGHIDALAGTSFSPVLAQQSIRELTRTNRSPVEVMTAAKQAVSQCRWQNPWGADADHLQTREDVILMAENGFTFFTIDPSAHVNQNADNLDDKTLPVEYDKIAQQGAIEKDRCFDLYLDKTYEVAEGFSVSFSDKLALTRAEVKYGAALAHTRAMAGWIAEACAGRPFEIEMSVDETLSPTSPLEHLFVGMELKRLGVNVVSLAPRFVGEFEKGIDYKGDLQIFETEYRKHAAIAKYCGPYKISIHSGSDKFSIYPIIARVSGSALHVKTAGTSYLEALRVICNTDKKLFRDLIAFCRERYNNDKATYHVSAKLDQVPATPDDAEMENQYLNLDPGRQVLHVTFGSVLAGGKSQNGAFFKDLLLENLSKNQDLYREYLSRHLGKHLKLLQG